MWSILRAIKRSWAQHFVSQFSGLVILVLSYSAVFFIALSLTNIERFFNVWGQISRVTIYLNGEIKPLEIEKLNTYLKNNEIISAFKLIDSKQAAQSFKDRFKDLSSQKINSKDLGTFFPSYYEVELVQAKAYADSSKALDLFAEEIKSNFSLVSEVSYGKGWLEKYISILSLVKKIGWSLIFMFLLGSLIVSSNVVKTILFHKKDEIEVLEFIGADDSVIYWPQIINILTTALTAFVIAILANYSLFYFVEQYQSQHMSQILSHELRFVPISLLFFIIALSFVSLSLYTFFTVYKLMPRQNRADRREALG